jgi:uncharacterized protein YlxW (UPF0749 family)
MGLLSALKLGRWHISLTIVFIILGILLSTSFYTQQKWRLAFGSRKSKLALLVQRKRRQHNLLEKKLNGLRKQLRQYEREAAKNQGQLKEFTRQENSYKLLAGMTPISGKGVEIVIADAIDIPAEQDANNYIVHDYDLQIIVNALWRAGAKAIAINNQRLSSVSGIRCAGSIVLVNSEPLGNPYKIQAVGDPKKLIKGLRTDEDAKQLLFNYAKTFGISVQIQSKKVHLPAYKGSIRTAEVKVVTQ